MSTARARRPGLTGPTATARRRGPAAARDVGGPAPARRSGVQPPIPAVDATDGVALVPRIQEAASRLGLSLDATAGARLAQFLGLLQRWGAVHNLSAVERPDDALVLHLFDSLAIVPLVARAVPRGGIVLDVGSGAGLPGLVIAATLPGVRVVCVDSVAKKAAFVRQAAIECGLPNLDALHARIQALGDERAAGTPDLRRWASIAPRGADLIVSRAFAALPDFVRWSERALAPGGQWLAMKGRRPDEEILALAAPSPFEVFHVEPLQVPDLDAQRCAVWIRRVAEPISAGSLADRPERTVQP